ncbi:MAG TPA: hypothetical protein VEB66_12480 [Opitutaceae bacterium]|nr:hypothetical protein [Opitutaceae bacterium]
MASAYAQLDAPSRRDFAVAWMNRGHELQARGRPADLEAALEAYAYAVEGLRELVREFGERAEPAWATSLGAALMNRGQLLHRVHGPAAAEEALACFREAEQHLAPHAAREVVWARRNLAGTRLNRAVLLLDLGRADAAHADAEAALGLAAPHERAEPVDADLGLKARRALCDAIGRMVVQPGADQDALAHAASDLVDDALALAWLWSARGTPFPRELALRIFRFGAQLYRLHQPHFLAEFLAEHLGPPHGADREIRAIALENIDAALAAAPGEPFYTVGDAGSERRIAVARELEALRRSLRPAPVSA